MSDTGFSVRPDTLIPNQTSPLKQFKSDIPAIVVCDVDLQLILKSDNGSSACETQQTAQILIERG